MAWEVTKLAIVYLSVAALIILIGNAIVRRVVPRVRKALEPHLAPTRSRAREAKVRASSLDAILGRLECDLSDVYRPKSCKL